MNKQLKDLNDMLFDQMERLSKDGISAEAMAREIERSNALVKVGQTIINNANLVLNAQVAVKQWNIKNELPMIGVK